MLMQPDRIVEGTRGQFRITRLKLMRCCDKPVRGPMDRKLMPFVSTGRNPKMEHTSWQLKSLKRVATGAAMPS